MTRSKDTPSRPGRDAIFIEGTVDGVTVQQDEDGDITSAAFEVSDLSAPVADSRRVVVTVDGHDVRCADGTADATPIDASDLATTLAAIVPGERISFGWDTVTVEDSDPPGVTSGTVEVPGS